MDNAEMLDALSAAGTRRERALAEKAASETDLRKLIYTALEAKVSIAEVARRSTYHRNAIRTMKQEWFPERADEGDDVGSENDDREHAQAG